MPISNGDLSSVIEAPYWDEQGINYLATGNTVITVPIARGARLQIGEPRALFRMTDPRTFSASPDGSRFSTVVPFEGTEERARRGLDVIWNWQSLLRSQVAASGSR